MNSFIFFYLFCKNWIFWSLASRFSYNDFFSYSKAYFSFQNYKVLLSCYYILVFLYWMSCRCFDWTLCLLIQVTQSKFCEKMDHGKEDIGNEVGYYASTLSILEVEAPQNRNKIHLCMIFVFLEEWMLETSWQKMPTR